MRKTLIALTLFAAGALPTTALASSTKTATKYKVGEKCQSSKDSTYNKVKLTCKNGKLVKESTKKS